MEGFTLKVETVDSKSLMGDFLEGMEFGIIFEVIDESISLFILGNIPNRNNKCSYR